MEEDLDEIYLSEAENSPRGTGLFKELQTIVEKRQETPDKLSAGSTVKHLTYQFEQTSPLELKVPEKMTLMQIKDRKSNKGVSSRSQPDY